jgi:hypothetical protein
MTTRAQQAAAYLRRRIGGEILGESHTLPEIAQELQEYVTVHYGGTPFAYLTWGFSDRSVLSIRPRCRYSLNDRAYHSRWVISTYRCGGLN